MTFPVVSSAQPEKAWFDKAYGAFGKSEPVYLLNKYGIGSIQQFFRPKGARPVSSELQKRWEEAQNAHGIPKRKHLPLYYTLELPDAVAETKADAVYLNPDWDTYSYEKQRIVLLHETTHVKYNDTTTSYIPLLAQCAVSSILLYSALGRVETIAVEGYNLSKGGLLAVDVMLLGTCVYSIFQNQASISRYQEKRADTEAAYHCACAQCCYRHSIGRSFTKNETDEGGYLSYHSWMKISDEFKKDGKYCAHHNRTYDKIMRSIFGRSY